MNRPFQSGYIIAVPGTPWVKVGVSKSISPRGRIQGIASGLPVAPEVLGTWEVPQSIGACETVGGMCRWEHAVLWIFRRLNIHPIRRYPDKRSGASWYTVEDRKVLRDVVGLVDRMTKEAWEEMEEACA